ncbi:hypothetical protein MRB53_035060 [Persea americana]|uniref:Uncharacterized protein n=1 Tax=Persea americana TaxID=3435 RepID=A0ACC2K476_PERAE|nr:hypothetical protein MRB53_035060 [Persea americana]
MLSLTGGFWEMLGEPIDQILLVQSLSGISSSLGRLNRVGTRRFYNNGGRLTLWTAFAQFQSEGRIPLAGRRKRLGNAQPLLYTATSECRLWDLICPGSSSGLSPFLPNKNCFFINAFIIGYQQGIAYTDFVQESRQPVCYATFNQNLETTYLLLALPPKRIWQALQHRIQISTPRQPIINWFCHQPKDELVKVTWTWWYLWKARNAILFLSQPFHPSSVVGKICYAKHEWRMVSTLLTTKNRHPIPPENWTAPPPGTHKLNVDGSFHIANGTAGMGGIIHDCRGRLVQAFACAITANSAIEAEMKALLRGIQLCVQNNLTNAIVEVHISAIYHSDLSLQQHMQVQEIGSEHLQEQEGLEQQEE